MFYTMEEVKAANKAMGRYWFSPGAMRFFQSRAGSELYGGKYFVSSERKPRTGFHDRYPRRYTIREAHLDGKITTVGEFQQYSTRNAAISGIKRILKESNDEQK